jgi:uncharacterized protein YbaR (Trm112 family)
MPLAPELKDIIRCPKCLGRVEEKNDGLACQACRLVYAIVNEIPNFLIEEARPLE